MEPLFYSTGQVARELGTTLATVRTLCESGVMASETSPGGHLRIPEAEVKRFKREGLPPIPRPLPVGSPPSNGTNGSLGCPELPAKLSDEVALAADRVAITRSALEKRRIDRDLEETEDWFRDRRRQQEVAEAAERQLAEARSAEQRRQEWMQNWTKYALKSVPSSARGEVEIEVHAAVHAALSKFQTCQPDAITRPLVDAALHRALQPWTRKQELESALKSAMNRLPWDLRNSSEHASLKQRAWEAAVEAVRRLREEASYREMETATVLAVQPAVREYEYQQACQRIIGRVIIFQATREEEEAARKAVRKALAGLSMDTSPKELEKVGETVLAPHKAAVTRRRTAECRVDMQLNHIVRYLNAEYTFDGGHAAMLQEAARLQPRIRAALIAEVIENPNMSDDEIRASIEDQVDDDT
jgi:excisionase family DNA binding protein